MKTKGLYIIIIIALAFMVSGIIFAEENFIKNPSFEEIAAGDIPKNWRTHSWMPDASGGQFGVDKEIAHSGKQSVFVFNATDNHGYYLQTVTVKENSFYKLSCWVKTENIKENLEGAGISVINYFEVGGNLKGTKPWTYAELYVSTGPDISSIEVMLQIGNYGELNSGKAWFDDVEVTKVKNIPSGALITVVSKKKDSNQSEVKKDTKNTPKETKNQGTFVFFLIVIIIVVLTGAAVVVFIIVTRKKKGLPDTEENDEETPDEET